MVAGYNTVGQGRRNSRSRFFERSMEVGSGFSSWRKVFLGGDTVTTCVSPKSTFASFPSSSGVAVPGVFSPDRKNCVSGKKKKMRRASTPKRIVQTYPASVHDTFDDSTQKCQRQPKLVMIKPEKRPPRFVPPINPSKYIPVQKPRSCKKNKSALMADDSPSDAAHATALSTRAPIKL